MVSPVIKMFLSVLSHHAFQKGQTPRFHDEEKCFFFLKFEINYIVNKMRTKTLLCYLTIGFLILSVFMEDVEGRRKILRGRKTITRHYYRGAAIPAWSIVVISGIAMLIVGGGLYALLRKFIISDSNNITSNPYRPTMSDEV